MGKVTVPAEVLEHYTARAADSLAAVWQAALGGGGGESEPVAAPTHPNHCDTLVPLQALRQAWRLALRQAAQGRRAAASSATTLLLRRSCRLRPPLSGSFR